MFDSEQRGWIELDTLRHHAQGGNVPGNIDRIDSATPIGRSPRKLIPISVATLAFAAGSGASAAESDRPTFSFSGFGTLGMVHSNEDRADFATSAVKPSGAGYTRSWSPDVDSRIGAQIVGDFNSRLSATVQVIAEQRYDDKYTPHLEWANIKYQVTPELSVRAGRTVLASFIFSDSIKVGYANPWVRPPVEVYSLVPISNIDGVEATYTPHFGGFVHTLSGIYGRSNLRLPDGGVSKSRQQWIISDTVEYGPATARIAYLNADMSIASLNELPNAFRQFGPEGIALADRYDVIHTPIRFLSVGGMYNPGDWFAVAEWGASDLGSLLGKRTAWYASGGYRIGEFTPYVTYAGAKANSHTSDPGLSVSSLPPQLAGPAVALNAALNVLLSSIPVQKAIAVGARWDFMNGATLKVQYDHNRLGAGSPGTLVNLQPDFQRGGTVSLFSATLDFVW